MRDFVDYLQEAFINASGGNTYDNSYSNLDLTARSLLGFHTPSGSCITLSSFVPPKLGTSYSIGIKDGWISYLYSSRPLASHPVPTSTSSDRIPLRDLLQCYRPLSSHAARHAVGHGLVYGRLYLPQNRLEALVAARVSPEVHLTLRAVSQEQLRHGATLLGLAAWDDPRGRFGVETLASSDGGVLGLRGLWNATNPPSSAPDQALSSSPSPFSSTLHSSSSPPTDLTSPTTPDSAQQQSADPSYTSDKERINGRFSAGGEIYYGLLNKSGGVSVGGRFQTLPSHHGTPLTATLTFNLLGHVSATYAVTSGDCTLASCFGFNMYSYESDWAVGMELWNRRRRPGGALAPAGGSTGVEKTAGPGSTGGALGGAREDGDGEARSENSSAEVGAVERPPGHTSTPVVLRVADDETPTKVVRTVGTAGEAVMVVPSTPVELDGAKTLSSGEDISRRTRKKERSFQAKLEWRLDDDDDDVAKDASPAVAASGADGLSEAELPAGVLKCRCDQHMRVGLMYEGRYKSLLFSLGTDVNLKRLDAPFRTVGLALQFSS